VPDQRRLLVVEVGDQLTQELITHQRPEQHTAARATKLEERRIVFDLDQLGKTGPRH